VVVSAAIPVDAHLGSMAIKQLLVHVDITINLVAESCAATCGAGWEREKDRKQ
jgi:hypothetical protein